VTDTPAPVQKATASPVPRSTLPIEIGSRVIVVTGGARLRSRSEPTLDGDIVANFDRGAELQVIGGPVTADDYIWWEVEGPDGRGWSAQRYLSRPDPDQ
jgi:hypothetical protein